MIPIEIKRQVGKLMATDKFGQIIRTHLLQSPELLASIAKHVEEAVNKMIEWSDTNSPQQRNNCTNEPF